MSRPIRITWFVALLSCVLGATMGAAIGHLFGRRRSWPRTLLVGTVVGTVLALGAEMGVFLVFGARVPKGAQMHAMLPEALRSRLPAATAAFEERCARVWGACREGASRTAVPDWLTR